MGRIVDLCGEVAAAAVEGHASVSVDAIGQLARRVARIEEILEVYREDKGPDRRGFDELRRRLIDHGIEDEMESGRDEDAAAEDDTSD